MLHLRRRNKSCHCSSKWFSMQKRRQLVRQLSVAFDWIIYTYWLVPRGTVNFVSRDEVEGNIEIRGKQNSLFSKGTVSTHSVICYIAKQMEKQILKNGMRLQRPQQNTFNCTLWARATSVNMGHEFIFVDKKYYVFGLHSPDISTSSLYIRVRYLIAKFSPLFRVFWLFLSFKITELKDQFSICEWNRITAFFFIEN